MDSLRRHEYAPRVMVLSNAGAGLFWVAFSFVVIPVLREAAWPAAGAVVLAVLAGAAWLGRAYSSAMDTEREVWSWLATWAMVAVAFIVGFIAADHPIIDIPFVAVPLSVFWTIVWQALAIGARRIVFTETPSAGR